MSDTLFSSVTSIFTVGGLVGSIVASFFIDRWGRKGTARLSTIMNILGPALMGVSGSILPLMFGRYSVTICATRLYS